ncbi:MAG: HlyD family efflux transporter periplasmic adaptor subunit [Saprospiraceae bacterium]|nr:HlyD family efflux transporter periplasmic adaptor subunit [Saprospiraceae bacterium]
MNKPLYFILSLAIIAFSCNKTSDRHDASGVFEAREIVISAEANGQLVEFNLSEGVQLAADQIVGLIDCRDLNLQKSQVESTLGALRLKQSDASPEVAVIHRQIEAQQAQINTLEVQREVLLKERDRLEKLVAQEAAPTKQLDDIQGQLDILRTKIEAAKTQTKVLEQQMETQQKLVAIRNRGVMSEEKPLQGSIARVENQISNCNVINPLEGTVLAQYVEQYEFVNMGKPLYKVADLDKMTLRAYLSGDQLAAIKLGQDVEVLVDESSETYRSYNGKITWIADKAEFTPKTIQTKNERANLVYAIKVSLVNDGFIRVGMYGELKI